MKLNIPNILSQLNYNQHSQQYTAPKGKARNLSQLASFSKVRESTKTTNIQIILNNDTQQYEDSDQFEQIKVNKYSYYMEKIKKNYSYIEQLQKAVCYYEKIMAVNETNCEKLRRNIGKIAMLLNFP